MNKVRKPRRRYSRRSVEQTGGHQTDMCNPETLLTNVNRVEKQLYQHQQETLLAARRVAKHFDVQDTEGACEAVREDLQPITEYLMQSYRDTGQVHGHNTKMSTLPKTMLVHREWEEKFLHEPMGNERPCQNSHSGTCFASKLSCNGITQKDLTLCEFYLPSEMQEIESGKTHEWPKQLRPCLLCMRAEAFRNFLKIKCCASAVPNHVVFQRIANIVGQKGEYELDTCFVSSPSNYEGILQPIVMPTLSDYNIVTKGGIKHVIQLHKKPETNNFFF